MAKRIRDKQRTKQKLIDAVGEILCKEGHKGIRINKIETVSGVNKKLIYDYFKGLNGLVKAYLEQVDFWNLEQQKTTGIGFEELSKETVFAILKNDWEYLQSSVEMQRIILWGISDKNRIIRNRTDEREKFGETLFKISDKTFENTKIDFRALSAILVSAIYYMILHGKTNGSTICGIDVTNTDGKERIFETIEQLLHWSYNVAETGQD